MKVPTWNLCWRYRLLRGGTGSVGNLQREKQRDSFLNVVANFPKTKWEVFTFRPNLEELVLMGKMLGYQ